MIWIVILITWAILGTLIALGLGKVTRLRDERG